MRLNIGSEIALFNPNSGEWKAVIKKINKQNIIAEVSEKISSSFVEPNISSHKVFKLTDYNKAIKSR